MTRWSIGTDTGGTFTDLVALDPDGRVRVAKTSSTPPDFERGVVDALRQVGIPAADIGLLYHGTTVSTNALITRTGAPTGLLTTRGFRDVLEVRDGQREELYDLTWDPPPPLVPRYNRLEVSERLAYDGAVVVPLDEAEVRHAAGLFRDRGLESVAVVLLHSYANAGPERRILEILREELPGVYLSISSDVMPEPPEFERTTTTVANAYVGPVLQRYVARLADAVREHGYQGSVLIMHSGGGTMTPENATRLPVRTATSGPAAGVLAAAAIAGAIGRPNVVSLDVGGTSADIATIQDGRPRLTVEQSIEWGMPLRFPSIDVIAIGAGGGSIAWIDAAGVPHSGPQSAGAAPGPAAYGRGGTEPTSTDANLVLGRLRPGSFLGGRVAVDRELARRAVAERFGGPLGLDLLAAAAGIIRIADENMANAVRHMTIHKGLDPREFALIAFGGAGPMHGVAIARELLMPEVIVPLSPGATSALGLLFADARHDFVRSVVVPVAAIDVARFEELYAEMEAQALGLLRAEGFADGDIRLERQIDLRYTGQVKALPIPVAAGRFSAAEAARAAAAFHREYEREYKYAIPEFPVETRSIRVGATGVTVKPSFERAAATAAPADAAAALIAEEPVYFGGAGPVPTRFYDRERLLAGARLAGPAIVEQFDSTTVLPPGASLVVDEFRNLVIAPGQQASA